MRKPWYRKGRGYFVTTDGGKQAKLGDTEEAAYAEWERLKASNLDCPDPYVAAVADEFLTSVKKTSSPATFDWYSRYILKFLAVNGTKLMSELKRRDLTKWIEDRFVRGARVGAVRTIKRCFNWALDEELIKTNPFARVKTPRSGRRDVLVSQETYDRVMRDIGNWRNRRPLRLFLIALRLSGARPSEVRTVTAEHFRPDLQAWVLPKHKRDKTTYARTVHLHPCLLTLTRILCHARPSGALFLNANKKPWRKNAVTDRMRRLRKKLGLPNGTVAYSMRHSFITEGLVNGVDLTTMAELTGTSVEMISRHYAHLDQKTQHLQRAACQAIRSREIAES